MPSASRCYRTSCDATGPRGVYEPVVTRALLLLAACALVAGCGGSDPETATTTQGGPPAVAASCIFAVEYDGHRYLGSAVNTPPPEGSQLGEGTIPVCNDTPGAVDDPPEDERIAVTSIRGVPPEIAVALRGRDDVVLIREDADPAKLPAAVTTLMR